MWSELMIPQIVWWCTQRARCSCTEAPQTTPSRRSLRANTREREHSYRPSLLVSEILEYVAWGEDYLGSGCGRRRAGGGPQPWRTRRQLQPLRSPTSMPRPPPPLERSPAASPARGSRFACASRFVNLGAAAAARSFRKSTLPRPPALGWASCKSVLFFYYLTFPFSLPDSLGLGWLDVLNWWIIGLFCSEFLGRRDAFQLVWQFWLDLNLGTFFVLT
jgi:hypothetical protein